MKENKLSEITLLKTGMKTEQSEITLENEVKISFLSQKTIQ